MQDDYDITQKKTSKWFKPQWVSYIPEFRMSNDTSEQKNGYCTRPLAKPGEIKQYMLIS